MQHIEYCELKISHLSKEVKQKEAELVQLNSELQLYEEVHGTPEQLLELLELKSELKRKREEVNELCKEKEQLTCSFNIEKEQVSKLLQIMSTLTPEKPEMKVCMDQ